MPPEQQQMQTGLKRASGGASEVRQRHDTDKGRGLHNEFLGSMVEGPFPIHGVSDLGQVKLGEQ